MYHIHCLNKISPKGTALLTDNYAITDDRNQADGVLVRSADMHNVALPESLLAVARAGAGVNNIPLSDCAEAGVVVFNTPGANANSVMELALCGMLLSSRDVVGGINWVQTVKDDPDIAKLVEKDKSKFAGHEIRHKNLGVIGLGAVGGPLANAARNLGMTVYGCDPFISIEAAWHLDSHIVRVNDRDEIYSKCDIISLHTPLLDDTRGMINAEAIAKKMEELDFFASIKRMDYDEAVKAGIITVMGSETDEKFLAQVMGQAIDREAVARVAGSFKMVYTPFHGTGYLLIPEALKRLGMKHVFCVPEQMVIDGNFPTVESPNPENPEGFYLAVDLAKKVGSDLIIGTDPDSDRIGVMVRSGEDYISITGNQLGVLLLDYVINARKAAGTLPENAGAVKSIVTTEMAKAVAETNGVHFEDTFTGFKFMAERIAQWEKAGSYKYIFAYEESYGYMMGDYVRDKDAVTASMMVAEMAAYYYDKGMNLSQAMESLYAKYGRYAEKTLNLVMPGLDGIVKMKNLMAELRSNPPKQIAGVEVFKLRDYSDGSIKVPELGVMGKTPIKGSNVLYFELADGTSFIVRPSGTEPKVKVYILCKGADKAECDAKIAKYSEYAEGLRK